MDRIRVAMLFLSAAMVFLPARYVQAVGDGPRAYQTLPDGAETLAVYGLFLEGNQTAEPGRVIQGGDIDVDLAVLQYTHTFKVNGQQGAFFGVLPYGEIEGSVDLPGHTLSGRSSGLGDFQLGCVMGLMGSPALSAEEYVAYKPGFALGVLGKVLMPTGEYDQDKVLNLGSNHWALQLGLPLAYSLGDSFLDPSLTRIELLPSVTLYSDNSDPYGADRCEQDPLLNLEGHITRNVCKAAWLSLDALYTYGGETTTDGDEDDNRQRAFYLGGTANLAFSKSVSLKLTYGETVDRNDSGPDGSMLRAVFSFVF